jgi:beta-mannanase
MLGGSWVKWDGIQHRIEKAAASHRIAMITLGPTRVSDRHKFSPGELAAGKADSIYISYSKQANSTGRPVWIRPMQEMNGYWMSYCAFNANGTRKGPAYATTKYKAAFRRIAIIMRGGSKATINAELQAAGLAKLQASLSPEGIDPSGQIALVWNPQGAGAPNVRGNQPRDYWPGKNYVDYVADDLYAQGGNAYWKGMQPLYDYGKPFILGEWAPWGYDDPTFVNKVFTWARNHPRTAALVYYDYSSRFDLSSKPRSLSAYRAQAGRAVFHTTA